MPPIPDRLFAFAAAMAGLHGAVAVALGAYAAHGMTDGYAAQAVTWVQTASTYQMIHAAALAGASAMAMRLEPGLARKALAVCIAAFAVGALLFCGTLYGLAFAGPHFLSGMAPVGGTMMIGGWLALAVAGAASFRGTGQRRRD